MEHQSTTKSMQKEQATKASSSSSLFQASLERVTRHPMLRLQRAIGNQAVQRMVLSKNEELVWVNPDSRDKVYHPKGSPFYENTKEGWLATETEAKLAGYRRAEGGLEAAQRGTAEHAMITRAMRPFEGQLHNGGWILDKVERSVGKGRVDELWINPFQKRVLVFDTYTGPVESLEHYRKGWKYALEPEIQKYLQQGYTYGYSVAIKHPTKLQ